MELPERPAGLRQAATSLRARSPGPGLHELTREIRAWAEAQSMTCGLLTIFCRHTSASLLIQENAAAEVRQDLQAFFASIAPEAPQRYAHDDEGLDDMPAHLRTALTQVQLSVPLLDGRLALGTWQGIFLFEHRRTPLVREIVLHLLGQ